MILQEFSVKSMENYFITVSSKQREEKNMPNVVYCKSLGCRHHVDKVKNTFCHVILTVPPTTRAHSGRFGLIRNCWRNTVNSSDEVSACVCHSLSPVGQR